jgi:hypothetical protein
VNAGDPGLPPIKKSSRDSGTKPSLVQADLKAERSVNVFLEQKYVEAVNESERNQAQC